MTVMEQMGRGLAQAPRLALDALLPPRCLSCGVNVARSGALCPSCWSAADFIAPPTCRCCGLPFGYDVGENVLCSACVAEAPPYDAARAVLRYDEDSKGLVLAFKHGDRTEGAAAFAEWMERAGHELLERADVLTPVPLHRRRLLKRRYNQAALLCHALGRRSGLPVWPDLLIRQRNTPPQGRLSPVQRRRNLQGALALNRAFQDRVVGRSVLLLDDVMTTGATASACARILKRAKAAEVLVLVLARVIRGGDGG